MADNETPEPAAEPTGPSTDVGPGWDINIAKGGEMPGRTTVINPQNSERG